MALTKQITWTGFDVPAAYTRVQGFKTTRTNEHYIVDVHTNVYKDSTKEICLYGVNQTIELPYNAATVNVADIYTELKKLDEWKDWADA